jgi:hypothetical protein
VKKNVVDFYATEYDASFNSTIPTLFLDKFYNLNLNSRLLNPLVFINLKDFSLFTGTFKSREVDLFGKLPSIMRLVFPLLEHFYSLNCTCTVMYLLQFSRVVYQIYENENIYNSCSILSKEDCNIGSCF